MQPFENYLTGWELTEAIWRAATKRKAKFVCTSEIEFWCLACEKAVAKGQFMIVPEGFGDPPNA